MPESQKKTRVLFVIGHLVQSGAERFTFEILKAIDRERYDVALLTKWRVRKRDFYYHRIRELGIPIHRRLPLWLNRLQRHARPFYLMFRGPLEWLHKLWSRVVLGNLLERYDVINAIQVENYDLLQPLVRDNRKIVIYPMSHLFQYDFNPYDDLKPGRKYRMGLFAPEIRDEYAGSPAEGAEEIHFPLAIDLSKTADLSGRARIEPPFRVGVFVRLSPDRPISGILEAFAELRRHVPAELWLYGRGDPGRVEPELRALGIRDHVVFKGHTPSIEKTLREDDLSLVWMTCFGPIIAYASIEVASYGYPMLFWNQHGRMPPDEIRARTNGAVEGFYEPRELALATVEALRSPEGLRARGRRLREYVLAHNEIAHHIRGLEAEFDRIVAENG